MPQFGYPDAGNGFYSEQIDYSSWFWLNNGQRVQQHFLENLTFIAVTTFVSALAFPYLTFVTQLIYGVSRLIFSMGYYNKGPSGRIIGLVMLESVNVFMVILALIAIPTAAFS